jgi:TPR repeat protein
MLWVILFSCSCETEPEKEGLSSEKEEMRKQNQKWYQTSKNATAEIDRLNEENTSQNKGVILATRPNMTVDPAKFKKVYRLAVKGDPEYQYSLGMCYKYGYGVKENKDKALFWFKKAADQGHKQADRVYKFMVNR